MMHTAFLSIHQLLQALFHSSWANQQVRRRKGLGNVSSGKEL